jgi:pimeloyl-ACP methyl ester carboxylesterase
MIDLRWIAIPLVLSASCVDLDSFVHNPVHCSTVTVDGPTCTDPEHAFDRICTPCDEPYDWAVDYDWLPSTLRLGESIRAIDETQTTIVRERLETDDGQGELDVYFVPSHGEVAELAQTTVVFNHGNYAGIEHYIPRVRMLHEAGFNVLVWDYRGYGKSDPDSTPSVDQFFADAHLIRDRADALAPDPERIILYANSLGGIPAAEMSVYRPGCALLWEAGFTSVSRIAESNSSLSLGESFLSAGRYDNVAKIAEYDGPLFVMIGDEDVKFPVADERAFFDAAAGDAKELWVLPGVNHGISNVGIPEAGFSEYVGRVRGFLRRHAPACIEPG